MEEVRNKMESILDSIKKLLGIQPEYRAFDEDLIIHINTVFIILNQLNIGPEEGFMIVDGSESWDDFVKGINETMVKTYIYLKVRLMFDPPTSGVLIDSMNNMISELEWRLYVEGDIYSNKANSAFVDYAKVEGGENDE